MDRGAPDRFVDEIGTRAELVLIDVLPHLVEARAPVEGQLRREAPLVLEIDAGQIPHVDAGVGEGEGSSGRHTCTGTSGAGFDGGDGPDDALLRARIETETDGVHVVDL